MVLAARCVIRTGLVALLAAGMPARGAVAIVQVATPRETAEQPGDTNSAAIRAFTQKIDEYVALHRKLEATLPPLPKAAAPAAVSVHQVALEKLIAAARRGAAQGDVFIAAIRPYIHRRANEVFKGPDGARQLADIEEEGSERRGLPARVNQRYPDEAPLSTMPFHLLDALPDLPEEVEYRFIARHLILLDTHARIVVDVLPDVLPPG